MRKSCWFEAPWNEIVRYHASSREEIRARRGEIKEAALPASAAEVGTEPAPAPAPAPPEPPHSL